MSSHKVTKNFTLSKLRSDGANWIMFQNGVELECASHSLKHHIDGTKAEPVNPHSGLVTLTPEQQVEVDAYLKELEKWAAGEATIRKGLSEALPTTLYLTVRKEVTTKKVWDAVVRHHHERSTMIVVELGKLKQMREDLGEMGHIEADENFRAIIIGSLPQSYDSFLYRRDNDCPGKGDHRPTPKD